MTEQESTISGLDSDIILPDGWEDDDSLFQLPEDTGYNLPPSDEAVEETPAPDGNADKQPEDNQPDDTQAKEDSPDAGKPDIPAEDVQTGKPDEPAKKKYTIRVNHETREVELTEAELIARIQKSYAADEKASREKYRTVYQEQIAAGMSEAAARLIAKDAANGKSYDITGDDDGRGQSDYADDQNRDDNTSDANSDKQAVNAESARDSAFRAELQQIKDIYPDFDTVPKSVLDAAADGKSMLAEYVKYRNAQAEEKSRKEIEKAVTKSEKKTAALQQRIRAAQQAPVKGVSSGGNPSAPEQQTDPFMSGFDSVW